MLKMHCPATPLPLPNKLCGVTRSKASTDDARNRHLVNRDVEMLVPSVLISQNRICILNCRNNKYRQTDTHKRSA